MNSEFIAIFKIFFFLCRLQFSFATDGGTRKFLDESFDREYFEENICKQEFEVINALMEKAFGDDEHRGKIDRLQFVGEACRMPKFSALLKPYLAENCSIVSNYQQLNQFDVVINGTSREAAAQAGSEFTISFTLKLCSTVVTMVTEIWYGRIGHG